MSYSSRVRRDISRWASKGLIDERSAEALARDVEVNERRSLSFGAILATMAALLLGAAILIFVAANWEAFPRPGRVGALFSLILAGDRKSTRLNSSHVKISYAVLCFKK